MPMLLPKTNKRKILSHETSIGNKRKQTEDRKKIVISNIVSIVTSPSKKTDHKKVNVEDQVHIVNKENLLQNMDI